MKRLQSCFERVLIKHGHLESKNKLLGVITEAINETSNLFSFRNTAANAPDYLPQNDDVTALNLQKNWLWCCSGDVLQCQDATPCRKGNTFIGGFSFISDVRSHEIVNMHCTALLEQCCTFDCRSTAGAMPPAQSMWEGKSRYLLIHVLVALSYKDFQIAYHYRLAKNSKENDCLYTTREMSQLLI